MESVVGIIIISVIIATETLVTTKLQQLKAIGHAVRWRRLHRWSTAASWDRCLGQGLGTLISSPLDSRASILSKATKVSRLISPSSCYVDLRTAQHAGPCKHGVVDRACPDEAVGLDKVDLDHHKVVDMLEILAYSLLGVVGITVADDEIAAGSSVDFVSDMAG